MPGMSQTPAHADLLTTFIMLAAMMAAMMLPAALPPVLRRGAWFAAGYGAVWTAFSAAAALLQWECARAGVLLPGSALPTALLSGLFVAGAGLYQITPLKRACLVYCRADDARLARALPVNRRQAVAAGLRYGRACLGCCWALMALMFVVGIMNIGGMAAIAVLVTLERIGQRGIALSRPAGMIFIACGTVIGLRA